MNNTRKAFVVILSFLLMFSLLVTGCAERKTDGSISKKALEEKIDNKTDAYLTDMVDSRTGLTDNEAIKKYLVNWAEAKGIRVKEDDGIVVMNVDGSIEYKNAASTVLICPYDADYFSGCINPMILTMYAIKNNEETGRLTALFVGENGHDMALADKLKKKYMKKGANVICLNGDNNAIVSQATGGASEYAFSRNFGTTNPKNEKAFRITIKNITSNEIDNEINSKINPIMELNTLLASLKRSTVDFEIASFRGGARNMLYPGACSLVITVDEDRQKTFESRIASRIESFNKRKQASDKQAVYEYEEVPVPDKVISQKNSARIVGFIYTLLEDEYHRDEDTELLMAVCDISFIRIRNGKVRVGSTAYSIDDDKLKEIDEAEETLCELSGFKYRKIRSIPSWSSEDDTELKKRIKKAYTSYTGKKLKVQPTVTPSFAGYVNELNDECDVIAVTVSDNTLKDLTGTVMRFLLKSNEEIED